MLTERGSGILLHPTSLPGTFGSGDFGPNSYRFVDWLASAGQKFWQILPLGEVGPGNSPYMSSSAFAGSLLMIDPTELADHGWLSEADLTHDACFGENKVDYPLMQPFRVDLLRRACHNFFSSPHDDHHRDYTAFCIAEDLWLRDYALFMTITSDQDGREWKHWPQELMLRDPVALRRVEEDRAEEIGFWKFCQWSFARQWTKLKLYANEHGIHIIGDVPIFVAYQSADVWSHQELFELDENGDPKVVAGVPPDYFSETGQLWGNPLYRWDVHEKTGYAWWIARMRHALQQADLVRIDHFRGFAASWQIPADAPNAISGKWVEGPGAKLFEAFQKTFPELPIIAEDLGVITPDVTELRDRFNLPGMRVLQFAFGEGDENHFLPHHYVPNAIAYTGTHDNDTSIGWWNSIPDHVKSFASAYLSSNGEAANWDMMRALSASVANIVIFPMQDVLGLPGEHRMNYPGQPTGNWEWRFTWAMVKPEYTHALSEMSRQHHRSQNET